MSGNILPIPVVLGEGHATQKEQIGVKYKGREGPVGNGRKRGEKSSFVLFESATSGVSAKPRIK